MNQSAQIESLTEALIEANDQLIGLYELADVTSQSLDEGDVVVDILERACRLLHADSLVLTTLHGDVSVGRTRTGLKARQASSTSVEARHSSGLTGSLHATRSGGDFSTGDRKLLSAVLRTTLTAVETARLHQRSVAAALDERERVRAAEVAQLALPTEAPSIPHLDLFSATNQARDTGGDLIAFHVENDTLMFAVGDVAGKGLPAAVIMTTAVCAIQAAFRDARTRRPGEQLALVNDWMYDHVSEAGVFITMFIGHHHPSRGELSWANAGQSPCLMATGSGITDLAPTTPPIGVLPDLAGTTIQTTIDETDVLLIGSDGVTEQADACGDPFGEARLRAVVAQHRSEPAAAIGSSVLDAVDVFAGTAPQGDDRTLVVLRQEASA